MEKKDKIIYLNKFDESATPHLRHRTLAQIPEEEWEQQRDAAIAHLRPYFWQYSADNIDELGQMLIDRLEYLPELPKQLAEPPKTLVSNRSSNFLSFLNPNNVGLENLALKGAGLGMGVVGANQAINVFINTLGISLPPFNGEILIVGTSIWAGWKVSDIFAKWLHKSIQI